MDYEDYYDTIKQVHDKESETSRIQDEWYKKNEPPAGEYDRLSFKAKKRMDKIRKLVKASMISSSILFFLFILLSLRIFGNDNYYTVKRGEDLYRISRKFNVPLNVLRSLNNIPVLPEIRRNNTIDVKKGDRIKIPTSHDTHIVRKGETLYDISQKYGVKHYVLVEYNKLADSRIKPGDRIFIPRVLSDIRIAVNNNNTTGLIPFMVQYEIITNTRDRIKSYHWDFGNGDMSFERRPFYTYKEKGTYKTKLTVIDENNNEIESNTLTIDVRRLANIQFNTDEYFEIGNKGDIISLNAKAIDNKGNAVDFNYLCKITGSPVLIKQIGTSDKFKIIDTGYSKITVEAEGYSHTGYYFVGPIPSVLVTRNDINWYKTQFDTGHNGNCGPSCVSMAILWAKKIDVSIRKIRDFIGFPKNDGGVGFYLLTRTLKKYNVENNYEKIEDANDIFKMIDRGSIVIFLFNRGSISVQQEDISENLFGRYYADSGGHYSIIKGYSLNKKYFVVYDPIPDDWWRNKFRYKDTVSMAGRNRYYAVSEVWKTISKYVLEIPKQDD
ncbi:MAG: LysM peptidoglycan-binding domain-containing protein [Spirochaetales bacterium]|nr:LysM peptidoglycan-binding domain-containing protein [Spirochaetales bacterium]